MSKYLVVLMVGLALTAEPASAQRQRQGGGRGGMDRASSMMLLTVKSVQEELKMTEDQVAKVKDAGEKMRASFQGLQGLSEEERGKKMAEMRKESEKAIADILKPEQAKRLHQIALQQAGAAAVARPEVAKELNLSDEQKKKIETIQEESGKETAKLRPQQGATDEERQEARKKMTELRTKANEDVMKVLSEEQQAKWKMLCGEPFKGEITFQRPPRNNQPKQ